MDPDQALANIRALVAKISRGSSLGLERKLELAIDLAEQIEALDEWLTNGGFKPAEWRSSGNRS